MTGNGTRPTEFSGSRVPTIWGEDHLLPRMPDGRGFMRDVLAPGGIIYRVSPDGKDFEVFSSGYRNIFDAALNQAGELFTYDADMEYDFNTPWYRPTRVCHVVSGSEFGWRNGAGKRPEWYPDNLPAVVNIGPGSPTGMVFGYGAKFPARYQQALFILDWSWGKLYAIHLEPAGATYRGVKEEFLSGAPLPLTDALVHPADGALYFAIGGRKVQSGLYRVTYVGNESTAPVKPDTSAPPSTSFVTDSRRTTARSTPAPWTRPGLTSVTPTAGSAGRPAPRSSTSRRRPGRTGRSPRRTPPRSSRPCSRWPASPASTRSTASRPIPPWTAPCKAGSSRPCSDSIGTP